MDVAGQSRPLILPRSQTNWMREHGRPSFARKATTIYHLGCRILKYCVADGTEESQNNTTIQQTTSGMLGTVLGTWPHRQYVLSYNREDKRSADNRQRKREPEKAGKVVVEPSVTAGNSETHQSNADWTISRSPEAKPVAPTVAPRKPRTELYYKWSR